MRKITLVSNTGDFSSFVPEYIQDVCAEYFNFELVDPSRTYDKTSTIFVTNCIEPVHKWYLPYHEAGYKILIDALWEKYYPTNTKLTDAKILSNENWFWYNESLWYEYLKYNNYIPNREYKKTALLLLRKKMPVRTLLINQLADLLDDFIYSYVDNGIFLDDDLIINGEVDQRYFNPAWYDQTCFSLVSETYVHGTGFITEKTFKPMAFRHPFMILGQTGTLDKLHRLGFETYDNLFDESYDTEILLNLKISKLINNISNYNNIPHNKLTLEKIEHNHNLFFNRPLVLKKFKEEIINPILEYAET